MSPTSQALAVHEDADLMIMGGLAKSIEAVLLGAGLNRIYNKVADIATVMVFIPFLTFYNYYITKIFLCQEKATLKG